jgi:hypothetical protein
MGAQLRPENVVDFGEVYGEEVERIPDVLP